VSCDGCKHPRKKDDQEEKGRSRHKAASKGW
jgi:hypothetical protein